MDERVVINVSGRRFETSLATLRRLPQSLLGDDQRRGAFWDPARSELFFDRSSSSFEGVLQAYQSGGRPRRPPSVDPAVFREDLRFYGLCSPPEGQRSVPAVSGWRGRLSAALEQPWRVPAVTACSLVITLVAVLTYMLITLPQLQELTPILVLVYLELICVLLLAVETVLRIASHPRPVRLLLDPLLVLDLIITLSFFIYFGLAMAFRGQSDAVNWLGSLTRLPRACRFFRFIRHTSAAEALKRSAMSAAPSLGVCLLAWVVAVLSFAPLLFWIEGEYNSYIGSIPNAIYFAVVTMTTVGFGDIIAQTTAGKIISSLCCYSGYAIAAAPVAVFTVTFFRYSSGSREEEESEDAKEQTFMAVEMSKGI